MGNIPRRARGRGDRGAALIEFAVAVPVLFLLALGTAEMGLAWNAQSGVVSAVAAASRVGATVGSNADADRYVLVALKAALSAESLANLDRVVVFKPINSSGAMNSACLPAVASTSEVGLSGWCNSYRGATVRAVTPTAALGTADDYWTAGSRKDSLASVPDFLGIYIRTSYQAKTGSLFKTMTVTRTSVIRLHPDIDG
jgi:Flp pilus assembly protein TadG